MGIAGFGCPVVGVVANAAFFVRGDLVAFHYPFYGAFAVDHVVVGGGGNVGNGDLAVVVNRAFICF